MPGLVARPDLNYSLHGFPHTQKLIIQLLKGVKKGNERIKWMDREPYAYWKGSSFYILACDSATLLVKPKCYDFFTRGLQPVHHYWPIRHENKCRSIKFAAQAIGKAASDFIQEELKMDYVYDYMFHLLNEYAKHLRFEPRIPKGATHLCSESMACPADESPKQSMTESLVKSPSTTDPCTMPPPYEPQAFAKLYRRNINSITQVQLWEDKFYNRV
ncbi:KDEL motif-containing protein 1-like [Pyrus ussuriensis x Pyrus communis]|uniref:KDEL motif-containing protein 1-like n=1 Tax=Pyrus ussuriensis x Pyrus communis TaxID=2448454 RepID=A0A5N5HKN5_9ROSA|nr:KDEL motif-containing protein 1-like [Pyrus ussuriensis x Pyrus communis]